MELHTNSALEEAARWYARLNAPDCTQQERDEFAQWQQRDIGHSQAFAAAERMADGLTRAAGANDRLRAMAAQALAMGKGFETGSEPADAKGRYADPANASDLVTAASGLRAAASDARVVPARPLAIRRSWLVSGALAAGIVVAVFAAGLSGPWMPEAEVAYSTPAGAKRQLVLSDGTTVHLDVGSEIEVQMKASSREVTLARGRALFDVAHDSARPFSVSAGSGRVTALGTVFQVDRPNALEVTVTLAEGAVRVSGQLRGQPQSERLTPGEELLISESAVEWAKRRVDTVAATSWSVGRHVFRDKPLGAAVDEVNRYAKKRVLLADPTLAELSISGSFVSGDSESVVAAFAAVLPIRVADGGDELLLFRRRTD